MKTTIEISDALAVKARACAARERITFRSLVEEGLREVLRTRGRARAFELRDASVGGRGLRPEYREADWQRIRDAAYEGRGS